MPADSRNLALFGALDSGPAVELRSWFELAEFGMSGTYKIDLVSLPRYMGAPSTATAGGHERRYS
jgi:hypothetical protein